MSRFKNIEWSPDAYAEAAVIAHAAGEAMLERLDWMTMTPKKILDVGCGVGKSSQLLSARYPDAAIVALDLSLRMVQYTQQRVSQVKGVCAEGETLPLRNQSVDLIFANFFLPWQCDIKKLLQEWLRVLSHNGLLILTAFGLNTLQECRALFHCEHTPEWVDMHDIGDALLQAGFADPVLDVDHYQVIYRDNVRLIQEMRASGLWFPAESADVERAKALEPTVDGVWPVTFEVVYAHAFAPVKSDEYTPEADGIVRIPLAHLRRRLAG